MYTIGVTRPGDLEAGSTFRVLKLWSPFLSFVSGEVAGQGDSKVTSHDSKASWSLSNCRDLREIPMVV